MRRRAFLVLSSGGALAACTGSVNTYPPPSYIQPAPQAPGVPSGAPAAPAGPPARPIGALLPLSGPRAGIGHALLQAAQLALSGPGSPALVPADTGGTAQGADAAVRGMLGNGAGLILGPLTAAETEAAAVIARSAGVPVLAFTNTVSAAGPGIWTLGITPGQQVRRLVFYAQAQGRGHFAALLPEGEFGTALAQALSAAVAERGLAPPAIRFHEPGADSVRTALRDLANYAQRSGVAQQPPGLAPVGAAAAASVPPPPFDVLLLGDTGEALAEVTAELPGALVSAPAVQIIGPALWAAPASRSDLVPGAWYAAPDPAARAGFVQAFVARYGAAPPGPADLAYDAASIARVLAAQNYAAAALTNPAGFAGVDGWLRLLPDGRVERGLAIFQVTGSGARLIAPAPTTSRAFAA